MNVLFLKLELQKYFREKIPGSDILRRWFAGLPVCWHHQQGLAPRGPAFFWKNSRPGCLYHYHCVVCVWFVFGGSRPEVAGLLCSRQASFPWTCYAPLRVRGSRTADGQLRRFFPDLSSQITLATSQKEAFSLRMGR